MARRTWSGQAGRGEAEADSGGWVGGCGRAAWGGAGWSAPGIAPGVAVRPGRLPGQPRWSAPLRALFGPLAVSLGQSGGPGPLAPASSRGERSWRLLKLPPATSQQGAWPRSRVVPRERNEQHGKLCFF